MKKRAPEELGFGNFSLMQYLRALGFRIFILFLFIFLFSYYVQGGLWIGVGLLALIFASFFVIGLLHKWVVLEDIVYGFIMLIILMISHRLHGILITSLLVLVLVHSLSYYFKSKRKYSPEAIFLTMLFSLIFAGSASIILRLIYAYVIFPFLGTLGVLNYLLLQIPIGVIFVVSYVYFSYYLLNKVFGEFDHTAFFRFNHFPFKILNIFSVKYDFRGTIFRLTILSVILLCIFNIILASVLGLQFVKSTYDSFDSSFQDLSMTSKFKYSLIFNKNQDENITFMRNIHKLDGQYFYFKDELKNIKTIYYDCDLSLDCKNVSFENTSLENQVPLEDARRLLITTNGTRKALFILPDNEFFERVYFVPFFSEPIKKYPQFQNLKIVNEIQKDWRKMSVSLMDKKIEAPSSLYQRLYFFFSGRVFDDYADVFTYFFRFGFEFRKLGDAKEIVKEYKWIRKHRVNNTPFYDGSESERAHRIGLRRNINMFCSKLENKNLSSDYESPVPSPDLKSLDEKSMHNMGKHLKPYRFPRRLIENMKRREGVWRSDLVNKTCKMKKINESNTSSLLRLKLVETRLARQVVNSCPDNSCIIKVAYNTRNPRFCLDLESENQKCIAGFCLDLEDKNQKCIIDNSVYTKDYCDEIWDTEFEEECMNK